MMQLYYQYYNCAPWNGNAVVIACNCRMPTWSSAMSFYRFLAVPSPTLCNVVTYGINPVVTWVRICMWGVCVCVGGGGGMGHRLLKNSAINANLSQEFQFHPWLTCWCKHQKIFKGYFCSMLLIGEDTKTIGRGARLLVNLYNTNFIFFCFGFVFVFFRLTRLMNSSAV